MIIAQEPNCEKRDSRALLYVLLPLVRPEKHVESVSYRCYVIRVEGAMKDEIKSRALLEVSGLKQQRPLTTRKVKPL